MLSLHVTENLELASSDIPKPEALQLNREPTLLSWYLVEEQNITNSKIQ